MILWFHEIKDTMLSFVGGKGLNLGILTKAGLQVPEGFCIITEAYKEHLSKIDITPQLKELNSNISLNELRRISLLIREKIISTPISSETSSAIGHAYSMLGETTAVAVRSSATAEDLADASFAGQQDTYLFIRGIDEVTNCVKQCWASLWGERAIQYRQKAGFAHETVFLSVVIQKMVKSDVAGVLFTSNPTSNKQNEFLINASYGLGESVVSGLVTPDTFVVDKAYNILNKFMGSKEKMIVQDEEKNTKTVDVQDHLKNRYCLEEQQIIRLCQFASEVEACYQSPQDIEWAFVNDNIYLLQSRPITTLNAVPQNDAPLPSRHFKDKHGMREHYPDAPLPLEVSFMNDIIKAKYDVFRSLGISLGDANKAFSYQGADFCVKQSIPGIRGNILKAPEKIRDMLAKTTSIESQETNSTHKSYLECAKRFDFIGSDSAEILKWITELKQMVYRLYLHRFEAFAFPMVIIGKQLEAQSSFWGKTKTNQYEFIATLDYVTSSIDKKIHAAAFRADKAVQEQLRNGQYQELLAAISSPGEQSASSFARSFNILIDEYGSRSSRPYQLFSTISWIDDPVQLLRLCSFVLIGEQESEYQLKQSQIKTQYQETLNSILIHLNPRKADRFKSLLEKYRAAHQGREQTLYLLEDYYRLIRLGMRQLAKNLVASGILKQNNEIYFLSFDELNELIHKNKLIITSLAGLRLKKRASAVWFWLPKTSKSQDLKGVPGSAGNAVGEVCIVEDVSQFNKMSKGKILVCPYTDPSWTPLFSLASGIISDTGGALSHAAIVAREYQIPAVLGTKFATNKLKDGDIVVLDGNKGTVHIQ